MDDSGKPDPNLLWSKLDEAPRRVHVLICACYRPYQCVHIQRWLNFDRQLYLNRRGGAHFRISGQRNIFEREASRRAEAGRVETPIFFQDHDFRSRPSADGGAVGSDSRRRQRADQVGKIGLVGVGIGRRLSTDRVQLLNLIIGQPPFDSSDVIEELLHRTRANRNA